MQIHAQTPIEPPLQTPHHLLLGMGRQDKQKPTLGNIEVDMIALCAHDIANALQYVQGILSLCADGEKAPVAKEDYIKKINKALNRAIERNKTIAGITFSQKTPVIPISLKQAIKRAIIDVPDDIHLIMEISDHNCAIPVPYWLLESFVHNTLENAVRALRRHQTSGRKTIKMTTRIEEGYYTIKIKDNGMGIPNDTLKTIGKKPVKNPTGSNGKSLYILSELLKQYGGQIQIKSEEGRGATFKLKAPLY